MIDLEESPMQNTMRAPAPDAEYLMRDTTSHPPALTPAYKTSVLRSPSFTFCSFWPP
ncbi:hypothetical protein [Rhizobacter sp. Root404]|uniref:hypothetical protein n=1 Tax=Rhizobacter sp. Root404 TaxID=1736528 RepID=UPI0009E90F42|nr:hypothetical protein [Rhizobacter sp. Root404]